MIAQALHKRVQIYLDLAEISRIDYSVETIHAFRVSARNLLAVEPLIRRVSETSQWKKMIRSWLKSLNQLRDMQVLQVNLDGHAQINTLLLKQMKLCLEEWQAISKTIANANFQDNLNASLESYCSGILADPALFHRTAASQWSKYFQKINMAIQQASYENPSALHKLRIRYKSMRYLATFFHDAGVIDVLDILKLKYWQDLMGAIQDLEVGIKWLQESGNSISLIEQLKEESADLRLKFSDQKEQLDQFIAKTNSVVRSGIEKLEQATQLAPKN